MKILLPTDDGLWTPSAPVVHPIAEVRGHINAMRNLMTRHRGVGLAAPQCGIALRFFIYGGCKMGGSLGVLPFKVIVNPTIVWKSSDIRTANEACLSFPGQVKAIARSESIRVDYIDYDPFTQTTSTVTDKLVSGYIARTFQHEIDHLDGICIVDRPASPAPVEPGVLVAEPAP